MCGIAGFTGARDDRSLDRMLGCLVHRGPDGKGAWASDDPPVSLGMTRLSIIDLPGGSQPMSNRDGTTWVVFNGEIFNAPELRTQLISKGFEFRSDHSDTEVLVHLYDAAGVEMTRHLNGMFAFVIFDPKRRLLFGARDRLGIKPLYLSNTRGRLAFASELKALCSLPWIAKELDNEAISHYLTFQSIPSPRSPLLGIEKLPPAANFVYHLDRGNLIASNYWRPEFAPRYDVSQQQAASIVRTGLEAAVHRWSASDVPIACSLSGGIDSSIVTALLARKGDLRPLRTFTLGFENHQDLDERALAQVVADRYGTEHHEIVLSPDDLLAELDEMVWHLDEPYGGGLPSWFVFKAMGQHVKVAMTGVGGDELFGNYGKWAPYVSRRERIKRALRRDGSRNTRSALYHPRYLSAPDKQLLLTDDVSLVGTSSDQLIEELWAEANSDNPRNAVAYIDLRHQLPNEFLSMVDRFSMAHSVEARTPFLDHEFIESVLKLPPTLRSPSYHLKGLLLEAAGDLLPAAPRRSPKRGFVLPMAHWLRGPLRQRAEELFSESFLQTQGIFRESLRDTYWIPFLGGDNSQTSVVWTLLFFQLWHQQFFQMENSPRNGSG